MTTILITNDDGINAPGIWALRDALEGLGDLWIVAPDRERSGVSHAFTLNTPLRVEHHPRHGLENCYSVTGTPVDSAKIALRRLMPEPPSLVVSGINRGENGGVNILYSGTVAGAMEGALVGIPSIAFSIGWGDKIDYKPAGHYARLIAEKVISEKLPAGALLNVNVPNLPLDKIKGIRITEMADSHYEENIDGRIDPRGRAYYWIAGGLKIVGDGVGTDLNAIQDGFVSITPLRAQLTDDALLTTLTGWNLE